MTNHISSLTESTEELLVDLAFCDIPASLLEEFMLQIVKPYYEDNLTESSKSVN